MRIEQLTFTRFLAALSIVIFHYGHQSSLFFNEYIGFLFEKANVAVSYFFTLSGFVMVIAYNNYQKLSYKGYYKNRFARIYPVYLLAIILVLFINKFQNFNVIDFVLNVLMIQSWFVDKALTINNPGWSLSVEVFFYGLFPIIYNFFYTKYSFKKCLFLVLLIWLVSQVCYVYIYYEQFSLTFFKYLPLLHINSFLLGNLTAYVFIRYKNIKRKDKQNLILFILSILIIIFFLKLPYHGIYHNGILSLPFCLFIYSLSNLSENNFLNKILSQKVFIYLGEISYGIYILQFPLWLFFTSDFIENMFFFNLLKFPNVLFITKLFILIIVSSIVYHLVEVPVRNFIKNNINF